MTKAAFLAVLLAVPVLAAPPSGQLPSMARLLERYAAGEAEPVVRVLLEAEASDSGRVLAELRTGGLRWAGRGENADDTRKRRLVLAAVALEVAGAAPWAGRGAAPAAGQPTWQAQTPGWLGSDRRSLLAWAIPVVLDLRTARGVDPAIQRARHAGEPPSRLDDAERRWFLAALAHLSGQADADFLIGFPSGVRSSMDRAAHSLPLVPLLEAARARFPDEPRFTLGEAFAEERRTTILNQANVLAIGTSTPEDGVIPKALFERRPDSAAVQAMRSVTLDPIEYGLTLLDGIGVRYEALVAEPAVRVEAMLRLGYHQIRVGERLRAIDTFAQVTAGPADADQRYLAVFFRGWTLHRLGRRDEAEREYEGALRIHPASRQVRTLLAGVLADRGARDEARDVLGQSLTWIIPARDPWTMFHRGDYRVWPERMIALRESLR